MKCVLAFVLLVGVTARVEFGLFDHESTLSKGWYPASAKDLNDNKADFVAQYNKNSGLKLLKAFKSNNCCIAVRGGDKLRVSGIKGNVFPSGPKGGMQCNPGFGYDKKTYGFYGAKQLKDDVTFRGVAGACATKNNMGVFMREAKYSAKIAKDGSAIGKTRADLNKVSFSLYNSRATPPGNWRLMGMSDFAEFKNDFIQSYNSNGIKALDTFTSNNCCIAVAGGKKLMISGTKTAVKNTHFQYPSQGGALKCNPARGYMGSFKFYAVNKISSDAKFSSGTGCSDGENPGIFIKVPQVMAELEFGMYNSDTTPAGGWKLMTIGQLEAHHDEFVTQYNYNSGIRLIASWKSKSCCFTLKHGANLNIKGYSGGVLFPATATQGIRCNPTLGYGSQGNRYYQFFGQRSLKESTHFVTNMKCEKGAAPGLYFRGTKTIETKAWTAHSDNKGRKCKTTLWSPFTSCSKTCGAGTKSRRRFVKGAHLKAAKKFSDCPALSETKACVTEECPVHCAVTAWSKFGACTAKCGSGVQTKTRTMKRAPSKKGVRCPHLTEKQLCNTKPCSIHCQMGDWSKWSPCNAKCGGGKTTRQRAVTVNARFGGKACESTEQSKKCNTVSCAGKCVTSSFSGWSKCSKECGGGMQYRKRSINTASFSGSGKCKHDVESKVCGLGPCPVHCQLSKWSVFDKCTKKCNSGRKTQTRTILVRPKFGGEKCKSSEMSNTVSCNTKKCAVDCVVGSWSKWSKCSKKCNSGSQKRTRKNASAKHGGKGCPARAMTRSCNTDKCAIDCKLSEWSVFGKCTVSCGRNGRKHRGRTVTAHPKYGGKSCKGQALHEGASCDQGPCPIHCKISAWTAFSSCSTTCGMGVKDRTRTIVEHAKHGGFICPDLKQTRQCLGNDIFCPVDCTVGSWAGWSPCPRTCGNWQKITNRRTVKLYARFNGKACPPLTKTKECNRFACPRDCQVSDWGKFGGCSKSCGSGTKTRTRELEIPAAHGGRCPKLTDTPRRCNAFKCPMDCEVSKWGKWTDCSAKCGGGKQTRGRSIQAHTFRHGGKACPPLTATKKCGTKKCKIHCTQGPWSHWSKCSKSCGKGATKKAWRKTLRKAAYGGDACGASTRSVKCPYEACPTDCKYSDWGLFTSCSASCGKGFKTATRTITRKATMDGEKCDRKTLSVSEDCNTHSCPRDCTISVWGAFGKCSKSCGEGVTVRTRTIIRKPAFGGKKCPGLRTTDRCFEGACPVGCKVGTWSKWSKCSKACGVGKTFATRKVVMKDAGSKCPKTKVVRECKRMNCPINCKPASKWSKWSTCTKECGGGKKTRTRKSSKARFGGKGCGKNELSQTNNCNTSPCAVDCKQSKWGGWGKCSKACDGGQKKRFRTLIQKAQNGGKACGKFTSTDTCNSDPCAIDCKVTWGKWNSCSASCGKGSQTRKYKWRKSKHGGKSGCGIAIRTKGTRNCNVKACPIHCQTNDWGLWSLCSKTCGNGKRTRTRNVVVKAQFGGKGCKSLKSVSTCNKERCPIDCLTSDWSDFSKCTRACGKGENKRVRSIIKRAANGGKACGPTIQYTFCNTQRCSIDCTKSAWGPFSKCSARHGVGTKKRVRTVAVAAVAGGKKCRGPYAQTVECNAGPKAANCVVSSWSKFSQCTTKCGVGTMTRTRKVLKRGAKGKHGVQCPFLKQTRQCQKVLCPVDCVLGKSWSPWTQCSKTCGTGNKQAVKRILKSAHSGGVCQHQAKVVKCNTAACPINCKMTHWSKFSACTKTCGNGEHFRTRKVKGRAAFGGKSCGHKMEKAFCNTAPCPIDCKITKWSKFSKCSKNCAGGKKTRKALKWSTPLFAGRQCTVKDRTLTTACNTEKCGINCKVSSWKKSWSKCTRTCGKGYQVNRRDITRKHKYGGKLCPALERRRECNTMACPVDCVVGGWSRFSKCSQHCGGGISMRSRKVTTYASNGGKRCSAQSDLKRCNTKACHWKESPAPAGKAASYTVYFDQQSRTGGSVEVGFVGGNGVSKMYNLGRSATKRGPGAVRVTIKQDIGLLFGLVLKAKGGAKFTPKGFINVRTPSGQIVQFDAQTVTKATGIKSAIPEEGKTARKMTYTMRIRTGKHRGAGSSSDLYVKFHGELGESRFYKLGSSFKDHKFYQKKFKVTEWIGKLNKITLESKGRDGLQLTGNALVKTASAQLLKFPTNFWLGREKFHKKSHIYYEKSIKAVTSEKKSPQFLLQHNDKHERRNPKTFKVTSAPTSGWNGKGVALKADKTAKPTSAPTTSPKKQCRNGKTTVNHGWHGAGHGKNYCNFCKCNNGKLSCTTRSCGKPAALPAWAAKCKHTTCEYTRAVAGKTTAFAAKHVQVNHHHKEGRQNHRCAYNPFNSKCNCYCWTDAPPCKTTRIAGTFTHFNSGKATGCEHHDDYLYDYKGTDCVWTSNLNKFTRPHSYKSAFVRFQVAEYGNLENADHLTIELKFCRTTTSCGKWVKSVHMRDDILGRRWTTVIGAPVTGYYHYRGKAVKDWKNFYANMEKYHQYVQIRVTLHSTTDYHERHIMDNLEVFGGCK
jgi:hypothetical protein